MKKIGRIREPPRLPQAAAGVGVVGARSLALLTLRLVFFPLQPACVAQSNASLIPRKRTKEFSTGPVVWAAKHGTSIYDVRLTKIKMSGGRSQSLMDLSVIRPFQKRKCLSVSVGDRLSLPSAMTSEIIEGFKTVKS